MIKRICKKFKMVCQILGSDDSIVISLDRLDDKDKLHVLSTGDYPTIVSLSSRLKGFIPHWFSQWSRDKEVMDTEMVFDK